MRNPDKSTKIIGAIALVSTALFLLKSRDNKESKKLDGLNIDIDPEKIVDNIKPYISDNPHFNNQLADFAKFQISKILAPKDLL